ncbi:MAG: RtcB family protein [Stenotrophomonas indicatrix]|uniref:RtcB family protein n=1 Tax=Stenotrophomonas indicatrix TaxID=2045451 RepID=UPI003D140B65
MTTLNYDVIQQPGAAPIKLWTRGVPLEDQAREQLQNIAKLPFIHKWISVMPDVHLGKGATVGSVVPTIGAIIPAAVGVDIGCGMIAVRTTLVASDLPDNLSAVRSAIERAVPHGRSVNRGGRDKGSWDTPPELAVEGWAQLVDDFALICEHHPRLKNTNNLKHLGTLGTGNHFIEVCLDQEQRVWFMLHSGSRGVGNAIGTYFIELAKQEMRRWMINLPDQDLAYLPEGSQHYGDYVFAVDWAQRFARMNREVMMRNVVAAVRTVISKPFEAEAEAVNCHHNYVNRETHFGKEVMLTRKGAVSARKGELGIIPGSMGAKSFIVRGLGNEDSFHSCSHGAGRVMSRTQARKLITVDDHAKATAHVECRKDAEVVDESPAAYKPIEAVMEAQRDLVEIVHTLRQVVCVKG